MQGGRGRRRARQAAVPQPQVIGAGRFRFFAGRRSDPFFADLDGLMHDFQFTGVGAFGHRDVFSIALEYPRRARREPGVRSLGPDQPAPRRQPGSRSIAARTAFFNAEEVKEEYNARQPAGDRDHYTGAWSQVLQKSGYTGEEAGRALTIVLPDILHYDRPGPAAYPNGRTLTGDVFDARLAYQGQVWRTGRW